MSKGPVFIAYALALGLCAKYAFFHNTSDFEIHLIDNDAPKSLIHQLQNLEKQFVYPFSTTEDFTIKHGINGDFFAFFKGLGKPYYYIARATKSKTEANQKADKIAAAVCCILRTMPTYDGKNKAAWYICDLKVDQNYQGQHLPLLMSKEIVFWRYVQCSRGFAICMNPANGDPKAVSIFKKHGPWPLDVQILNLYNLSASQVQQNKGTLKKILIDHGYMKDHQKILLVSTSGAKDYKITNTITQQKRPWHLLHIKVGEGTQASLEQAHLEQAHLEQAHLAEDATYMICAVEGTGLDNTFKSLLGIPSSTAQIVSYGMKDIDFNYLTSNQI